MGDRFQRLEYPNDDFPFYDGRPVWISAAKWLFVMAMVALGFAVLVAPIPLYTSSYGQFIPAVLFFAIPLIGLAIVAPAHWTAIFRRITVRHVGWMIVFAVLNVLVSLAIGIVVMKTLGANSNPAVAGLVSLDGWQRLLFYLKTIPQLFGEELLTMLPFLALLTLFSARLGFSRKTAIVLAWMLSALLFGLVHLPSYGWNIVQCVVVIGSARLILTLPYIMTKSIWVSTGAHILNDWMLFYGSLYMLGLGKP